MKILSFLILGIILSSCDNADKASYEVDPNFNKVDEQEYLELSKENEVSREKQAKNFNYSKYYEYFGSNINKYNEREIKHLLPTLTHTCSEKTINTQFEIMVYVFKKFNDLEIRKNILDTELSILNKCQKLQTLNQQRIRRLHSEVLEMPSKEIIELITKVIEADKIIASKRNIKFSSLRASELQNTILQIGETSDLDTIVSLIEVHKKISPLSRLDRVRILNKLFDTNNYMAVFSNSRFKSKAEFLNTYLQNNTVKSEGKIQDIILLLISDIESKYNQLTRFEDVNEVLEYAWSDYTQIVEILNSDKLEDKNFITQQFGKLNLIIENIYELEINRTPAERYLSHINGLHYKLALFHLMRLKENETRELLYSQHVAELQNDSFEGFIHELLKSRLNLYSKENKEKNMASYCKLLNDIKFNSSEFKNINNVEHLINDSNAYGCYEKKFSLMSNSQIALDQKNTIRIETDIIKSPIDQVIKAVDTDVQIKTKYYNGPIWYLPTSRNHSELNLSHLDLDARYSTIIFNVQSGNESFQLFYNYEYKAAEAPKAAEFYFPDGFKKGFRGGNLRINVDMSISYNPTLISPGGMGQKGPKSIHSGAKIEEGVIYSSVSENLLAEIFNLENIYTSLGKYELKQITSKEFSLSVNKNLTQKLHADLCKNEVKINPNDICFSVGMGYKYRKLGVNELSDMKNLIIAQINEAASLAENDETQNHLLSKLFNFSTGTTLPIQKTTEFLSGEAGQSGRVYITPR